MSHFLQLQLFFYWKEAPKRYFHLLFLKVIVQFSLTITPKQNKEKWIHFLVYLLTTICFPKRKETSLTQLSLFPNESSRALLK